MSETRCPFCTDSGTRSEIHLHMVESHPEGVETWTDARRGRMRYRIECPVCGDGYEHVVKPRSRDPQFLETFAREIRMVAFDMLLSHVEAEHAEGVEGAEASAAPPEALPDHGPGGGTGRPGYSGVPLPPGMDMPPPPGIPGHARPDRDPEQSGLAPSSGNPARRRP